MRVDISERGEDSERISLRLLCRGDFSIVKPLKGGNERTEFRGTVW